MKNMLVWMAIAFSAACNHPETTTATPGKYLVKNISVIPMDSNQVLSRQDVLIIDGTINAIENTGIQKEPKDALVIDGTGKFLMPGLAEMHAHVPTHEDTSFARDVLELYVLNGVTTIRGMLGHPNHLALRDQIHQGSLIGPRFYAGAPGLMGSTVHTVKDADSLVRKYKSEGYDFLKLLPGLTLENFRAIVKTANEINIPFAGHVSADVGVWNAIEAEQKSIDHLDGFVEALVPGIEKIPENKRGLFGLFIADKTDWTRADSLIKALRNHHVWIVPTQALAERWFTPQKSAEDFSKEPEMKYMNPETLENWKKAKANIMAAALYDSAKVMALIELRRKFIKACYDNQVLLVSGSDAPQVFDVPGFSLHQELQYMVDAGLSPFQVLQTSTLNAGKYLGNDNLGIIKKGAVADLILLNANPLEDIRQTANIAGVFSGKRWFNRTDIEERLTRLEGKIRQ